MNRNFKIQFFSSQITFDPRFRHSTSTTTRTRVKNDTLRVTEAIRLNNTPLNQYINETDPKYSNYDPIPTHFIPSNITPLFSHSHVNHTNRKISRRLYQTPATLPFYSIMGAQILQPLPGTRAIGRPRGAHAHNSTRSIPCVSHTHSHGRAHDSNLIKHRGSRL